MSFSILLIFMSFAFAAPSVCKNLSVVGKEVFHKGQQRLLFSRDKVAVVLKVEKEAAKSKGMQSEVFAGFLESSIRFKS